MVDKIQGTLFINLATRPDRLIHVNKQLESIGIKGERFNAIKLANGRIGCSMSHIKCIELAKQRGWDNVFICEDDICFNNPELFKTQLGTFMGAVPQWDVIIVGGNNLPPFQQIGDFCIKVSHCQTTTGYIVSKHYYDTLIENFREGVNALLKDPGSHLVYAIDKHWIQLQRRDKWYMIIPATVTQLPNYSDIEGQVTDYSWHMTDIVKEDFLRAQGIKLKREDFIR